MPKGKGGKKRAFDLFIAEDSKLWRIMNEEGCNTEASKVRLLALLTARLLDARPTMKIEPLKGDRVGVRVIPDKWMGELEMRRMKIVASELFHDPNRWVVMEEL